MAMSSIVTYVFSSLLLVFGCFSQQDKDTLVMVQILYRHGDRSPFQSFPTNPLPESAWPQGFGQLTRVGMVQHFDLGIYLRKRYVEGEPYRLLNASYNCREITLRSTDFDRTLMSAYSNLAGLYPPSGDQIWNKDVLWQPIPVHTVPVEADYLLDMDVPCPKYDEYFQAALNSDEIKKEEEENKGFYQLVANKTGLQSEAINVIWDVYDPIFCARTHGLTEPEWVNMTWKGQTVYDKLKELNTLQFEIEFNRPGESRLRGGPLLKEMIENMKSRMSKQSELKSHIYSAHDSIIAAFLSAAKVFDGMAPPYATAVLLELHQIDGKSVIRLLYKNDSTLDAYTLQIPGCSDNCLLEDFIRLTSDNIPVDWHSECQTESLPTTDTMLLLGTGIILVSLLLVTILVFVVLRTQGRRKGYKAYNGLNDKDDDTF